MVPGKISPTLAESMQCVTGDDMLDVVVELPVPKTADVSGASRADRISSLKETFTKQAEPLVQQIRSMGGEITDEPAWINGSLRARVAKDSIPALTDHKEVRLIDLSRPISLDARLPSQAK